MTGAVQRSPGQRPALALDALAVRFGGVHAVQDLTLRAEPGVITGLIGPNGAGKTTTFNVCSGMVTPTSGSVVLGDRNLRGCSPAQRAQLGLGRTFQRVALCETLTVRDNVTLGGEARLSGCRPWGQLHLPRRERRVVLDRAEEAMARCGITDLAGAFAGDLSTGQSRLVELARVITGDFDFLLLDEPSSGLDVAETEEFGAILGELATRDGVGILLIEHDMALVRRVCSYLYVLDFGRLLVDGPAGDVLRSDLVQAAYLGTIEVA